MSLINHPNTVEIRLRNLTDVNEQNKKAHESLGALLGSITGRLCFIGGTVAIIDDNTIHVIGEVKDGADKEAAHKALRGAFFKS